MRKLAWLLLGVIGMAALLAPWIAPYGYAEQFRDAGGRWFAMGVDDLGRDRLSRLLYGTRISLGLAPAAALVSIAIGLVFSFIALRRSRLAQEAFSGITTIFLSLPWIFLFVIMRAELPLNTSPMLSMVLTFGLMGIAGWAWAGRVFTVSLRSLSSTEWMVQARASGMRPWRIATVHLWPHVRAIAWAQFRILVPAYILAEASLGLLGLGVTEPLPSWGNLLLDLQHPQAVRDNPWVLAPLVLLMLVMICLEALATPETKHLEATV
jgi:ABC-type dipeptide/oligopeptide/nickel transport system permease subunit